jgi:dipeptide/tripeptide permease
LYEGKPKEIRKPYDNFFQFVAAWFAVFDIVFVIILIPVFDRIIYPRLARAGRPMGFVLRVSMGMVIAAINSLPLDCCVLGLDLWCLMPLSTTFQLYRGG